MKKWEIDVGYKKISLRGGSKPRGLQFDIDEADTSFTDRQMKFREEIGDLSDIIVLVDDIEKKRDFFDRLLGFARGGLIGNGEAVSLYDLEMSEMRDEVLSAVGEVRNALLFAVARNSLFLLLCGVVLLSGYLVSFFIWNQIIVLLPPPGPDTIGMSDLKIMRSFVGALGYSFVGLYFGLVISSLIRAREMDAYEPLRSLRFHGYGVKLYNLYLAVLLVAFFGALAFDALQIGVAGKLLNNFDEDPVLGLLVGAVCAFGETPIAKLLDKAFGEPDDRGNPPVKNK
ncbi:hypothetical protein ACOTTU_19335 [Roseobacter sp. EG26]|uniref:hypothetical protein n=1 Tax=Roseobacter sp. EG26 TaxID=3412477 RepID=UPI003CE4FD5B